MAASGARSTAAAPPPSSTVTVWPTASGARRPAGLTGAGRAALDATLDRLVLRARALPDEPDAGGATGG